VPDPTLVSPDGYSLDNFYLTRTGAADMQLDLFGDYKSNVALYPTFQTYLRAHKPRLLAVWGKNDPFFLPAGAEAFKRDIPNAVVRFLDTGHFALETHAAEIASAIRGFMIANSNCPTNAHTKLPFVRNADSPVGGAFCTTPFNANTGKIPTTANAAIACNVNPQLATW
jgi:hypothetical protein